MNWKNWILSVASVFSTVVFLAGCAYDNNYLRTEDFATYLEHDGVKVESVRTLRGEPFYATSGCAIMIDGSEIGVYKYDRSSTIQKNRVERLEQEGRTYIQGIPFPIEVRGSFMFLGLEKNPQKQRILKTINKFY